MLNDLSGNLTHGKSKDLIGRLNQKNDPAQLIGAEIELALVWAIQRRARLEIEPNIGKSRRKPDAFSPDLFDRPAFIEITTISDEAITGEKKMRRIASKIVEFANTVRRGSGEFLYFDFHEKRYTKDGRLKRDLLVSHDFELDDVIKKDITNWLSSSPSSSLDVRNDKVSVSIVKRDYKQNRLHNFHSTRPPLIDDVNDNPITRTLREKEKQLCMIKNGWLNFWSRKLKVVFLVDAGCTLLRDMAGRGLAHHQDNSVEGVIQEFLLRSSLDCVCVFSPHRKNKISLPFSNKDLAWSVMPFFRPGVNASDMEMNLLALAAELPAPRFEGYQARTIQQQGGFQPQGHGWYLGTRMEPSHEGQVTLTISSRLVQEYLAGRITKEEFEHFAFNDSPNLFESRLRMGWTINHAGVESGGLGEDDDHLVFGFMSDPAASPFKAL